MVPFHFLYRAEKKKIINKLCPIRSDLYTSIYWVTRKQAPPINVKYPIHFLYRIENKKQKIYMILNELCHIRPAQTVLASFGLFNITAKTITLE